MPDDRLETGADMAHAAAPATGNPVGAGTVGAGNRYPRPEIDNDPTVRGEEAASPATRLDHSIDGSLDRGIDGSIGRSMDSVEMERLRELLREQQKATLRAIHTAADLQSQLATVQTEVKTIGKQYHSFSKQARAAVAQKVAEVEIAKVKSERHEALRELDRQKEERRAEATRAAAHLANVRKELTAASVAGIIPGPGRENRMIRHATVAVITAVAIVGSAVAVWRTSFAPLKQRNPSAERKDSTAAIATMQPVREYSSRSSLPVASSTVVFPPGLSPEPAAALASAMTQLDTMLSSFPGRKPEDVLREASKIDYSCRMQWNDGNPSLLFGGGASNSLTSTISHCAEAVKRLH